MVSRVEVPGGLFSQLSRVCSSTLRPIPKASTSRSSVARTANILATEVSTLIDESAHLTQQERARATSETSSSQASAVTSPSCRRRTVPRRKRTPLGKGSPQDRGDGGLSIAFGQEQENMGTAAELGGFGMAVVPLWRGKAFLILPCFPKGEIGWMAQCLPR